MIKPVSFKIRTILIIAISSFSPFVIATPQNQLDSYYNGMSNTTQPGSYTTQQRGVFFGGRYTEKQPTISSNLVDIRLPSATGGCGGIDVFGGSFSFINADQLVATMRAVASNAKGYAFSIALNEMCPDCMTQISKLQDAIQKMNSHMADSCQMAQGLTIDVAGALGAKHLSQAQKQVFDSDPISTTFSGIYDDAASVLKNTKDTAGAIFSRQDAADLTASAKLNKGALLYKAMANPSGGLKPFNSQIDMETMEVLLSLFGSPNIMTDSSDPEKMNDAYLPPLLDSNVLINALIGNRFGTATRIKIYDCSLSKQPDDPTKTLCMISPSDIKKDVDYTGLMPKLYTALKNYKDQIANHSADSTSAQDKNAMVNIGHQYLARVATLARCKGGSDLATGFIDETIDSVVLSSVEKVFGTTVMTVKNLPSVGQNSHADEMRDNIDNVTTLWGTTINNMRANLGATSDIKHVFNDFMKKCDMTPVEVVPDTKLTSQ